jgi:hypothetical protein
VGGGGETDVQQVEAQDAWIFRRCLGHVRMASLIVCAKIAVPCTSRMPLVSHESATRTGELEAFRLRAAGSQVCLLALCRQTWTETPDCDLSPPKFVSPRIINKSRTFECQFGLG